MESVAEDHAGPSETLRKLYAPIAAELDQVEETLRDELRSDYPFVDLLVKHGFRLGGKRLRPALVLLTAKACGNVRREHLVLGAVMELIHTATLIHDDVLDEATLRRHLETINARWDNEASVLLGDYLFSRSVRMASTLDDSLVFRVIGEATQTMCEGELRQVASRGNFGLEEAAYLDIIAAKTAALTSCCCRLGSYFGGASPGLCEALAQFGHDLGIAFQIADDVLDLLGDEATAGKSLGTDLAKQKMTLPLIHVFRQVDLPQRAEILAVLSRSDNHRRDALRPWIQRCDAIAYAREKARSYSQAARAQLVALPITPARQALEELTEFVIARQH